MKFIRQHKHSILTLMATYVLFGSFYLIYLQSIDGVLINKPITFLVDTNNFQTDKAFYQAGDEVSIFTSYCRNRDYAVQSTWRLINETVITYPVATLVVTKGCLKDKWISIGKIPVYAVVGLHHLEGASEITLNPLHKIYYSYRSQDFYVK